MRRRNVTSSPSCAPRAGIRRRRPTFSASSARPLRAKSNDSIFFCKPNEAVMKTFLASLAMLTAAAATTTTPAPVGYRFDDVKRTLMVKREKGESPAAKGVHAQSGDRVHTGWFSYALIAAEPQRAK